MKSSKFELKIRELPEQAGWRFDRSRSEGSAPLECAQVEPLRKVPVHKNLYSNGNISYITNQNLSTI